MASDDEDVNDCTFYGTPLDPIEEDDIPRKRPYSVEEQVVLDKQGRRRFHGAFTGGFSAGFFNTVGTLEGWKPSAFKSSRSERGGGLSQKPEDFMDEEDMEEFGIAPKIIQAKSDYKEQSTRKRSRHVPVDGPIPGEPVLHSFLQPVRETVGVRLLKKMGWKPGQGVGPRLTMTEKRRASKAQEKLKHKVYGCSLPDEFGKSSSAAVQQESSEDEVMDDEVLYAPDDIQPFKCVPKDDLFGIGYSGLDRRPILFADKFGSQKKSVLNLTENKKKISISGQAFGVGAFEEEDDDIYSTEDMSHYDFSLEDKPEKKAKSKASRWSEPVDANYAGKPLEGFVLAKKKPILIYFPPPKLPPDFQPIHQVRQTRFEPAPVQDESLKTDGRRKGLGRHDLSAADRVAILSGTQKKSEPSAAAQSINEINVKVEPGLGHDKPEVSVASIVPSPAENDVSSKNEGQFRPFAANPDKQHRYEQYLALVKSNQKSKLSALQPLSMTEWERDRERLEFEQASKLYQPLSGLMFDRFVSAMHPDVGDEGGTVGVTLPKEEESEKKKAAKMKMFGRLTRDVTSWTPCSLLYKRFNVPDPGFSAEPEVKRPSSKFSVFDFMASSSHNSISTPAKESSPEINKTSETISEIVTASTSLSESPVPVSAPTKKNDGALLIDEEKFPTNKIDLFKAIFLSSSESESDGEAETVSKNKTKENLGVAETIESNSVKIMDTHSNDFGQSASEVNTKRNMSPPRGVFANLDLDAINHRVKPDSDKNPKLNIENVETPNIPKIVDVDVDGGVYGPRLPDKPKLDAIKKVMTEEITVSSGSDSSVEVEWVEKSAKKHKKSKHHKKYKKHKSKHKHKKR